MAGVQAHDFPSVSTVLPMEEAITAGVLDPDLVTEAQRQFDVCLACRYCEGLCAVFPALERRSLFTESDALYLANLCHDCRSCFDACPFATPHVFAVDFPPLLSTIRERTYEAYSVPRAIGRAVTRRPWLRPLVTATAAVLAVVIELAVLGWDRTVTARSGPRSFYDVVPYMAMTLVATVLIGLALVAMGVGLVRFWKDTGRRRPGLLPLLRAVEAAATLKQMRGGGPGCTYPDEAPEHRRLLFHSLVFYGFMSALASTTVAAVLQELLDRQPPYPVWSLPVVLGILGGVGMIAGCVGLLVLKGRSRHELMGRQTRVMDLDFITLLLLLAVTGLVLLVVRATAAMGILLAVHLGLVAALFVTFPYGKFVHAVFRTAALTQNALEEQEERAAARG